MGVIQSSNCARTSRKVGRVRTATTMRGMKGDPSQTGNAQQPQQATATAETRHEGGALLSSWPGVRLSKHCIAAVQTSHSHQCHSMAKTYVAGGGRENSSGNGKGRGDAGYLFLSPSSPSLPSSEHHLCALRSLAPAPDSTGAYRVHTPRLLLPHTLQ